MHLDISDVANPYNTIFEKDVSSFNKVMYNINMIGKAVDFSDDYLVSLYVNLSEIEKIPTDQLIEWDERFDLIKRSSTWIILMNMKGLIIAEFIRNGNRDDYIDYYEDKTKSIKPGDVIYYSLKKKYYLVLEGSLLDGDNSHILFGLDEIYSAPYNEYIPLYYINKVPEQEEKQLHLKELYGGLYNKLLSVNDDTYDEYDEYRISLIKKYPWL